MSPRVYASAFSTYAYQSYRRREKRWGPVVGVRPVSNHHESQWRSRWSSDPNGREWRPIGPPSLECLTNDILDGTVGNRPNNTSSQPVFEWHLQMPPTLAGIVGLPLDIVITVSLLQETHADNPGGGFAAKLEKLTLLSVDVSKILSHAIVGSSYFWNDEDSVAMGGSGIAKIALSGIFLGLGSLKVECSAYYGWFDDGVILPLRYAVHVECTAVTTKEVSGSLSVLDREVVDRAVDGFELLDLSPLESGER